jgi:hypothetical protein
MIKRYFEFINEKLEILLESNVVYSDDFKKVLSMMNTPLSKTLLDMENKDYDVKSNYFDIIKTKNDYVSFIPDKKAQDIIKSKELVKYTVDSSEWLEHTSSNNDIFNKLGYKYKEDYPYCPRGSDIGEVINKVSLDDSNYEYVWVKFKDINGNERGEGVYTSNALSRQENKDVWSKNRQNIKVGKIIRPLLKTNNIEVSDKEIEEFVNLYKSTIDKINDKFHFFEIVEGDDIAFWYNIDNYYETIGTLGSSCMRTAHSTWFEIYTKNPNQVNLVILKSDMDESKIVGRALLWYLPDGKKFMDRIYTTKDHNINLFRDYAKENGWYVKYANNSCETTQSIDPNGSKFNLGEVDITLDVKDYDYFPYLDTFKFFIPDEGLLSNIRKYNSYILEGASGDYIFCNLCNNSGTVECCECNATGWVDCYECDSSGEVTCYTCDGEGEIKTEDGREECSDCDGTGHIKCDNCGGSGRTSCSNCYGDGKYDCPECG